MAWSDYDYTPMSSYNNQHGGYNAHVSSTKTSKYDDGEGPYVVMSTNTIRSWKKDQSGAVDHASNLIDRDGNKGEFLILKVVARVKPKYKKLPVTVTQIK